MGWGHAHEPTATPVDRLELGKLRAENRRLRSMVDSRDRTIDRLRNDLATALEDAERARRNLRNATGGRPATVAPLDFPDPAA